MYTSDEKDKAEKRKMRSVIMIAAGVLLLVVGVLLIVLAPTLSDSNNMMPNVIGIDRDKAKAMLEKHGLEVIEIEVESDEYEPGVVIEQSIAPGKEIEQGMTVELTINVAKGGISNMFGSAPPMESVNPDDADTDGLERNNGGGYNGGGSGGGSNPTPAPTKAPTPTKEPTPTTAPEPTKEPTPTTAPEPTTAPAPTPAPVVTPDPVTPVAPDPDPVTPVNPDPVDPDSTVEIDTSGGELSRGD